MSGVRSSDERRGNCDACVSDECSLSSFMKLEFDAEFVSVESLNIIASICSIGVPGIFSDLIFGPNASLHKEKVEK